MTQIDDRVKIAKRAAEEIENGQVVNLGVGIPTLIPDYLGNKEVYLQSENGLLGIGPSPDKESEDMDLISASKEPITMIEGASIFDSAASFGMIRGGHVDVAVLGTLQIDETGKIANWSVPNTGILGVGGAMDLLSGANKIIVVTTHCTRDGSPKLLKELTYPSSGDRQIDMVITEHAVFTFEDGTMKLIEILSELTVEKLKEITEADFVVDETMI